MVTHRATLHFARFGLLSGNQGGNEGNGRAAQVQARLQHRIAEGEYIAYTSLDDTYPERLAETTAWMLGALVLGVANDANGAKTAEARAMEILSAL